MIPNPYSHFCLLVCSPSGEVNFEPGGPPLPMVFAKALAVACPDVLPKDIDSVGSSEYYPTQWLYGKVYSPLSPYRPFY